MGDKVLIIDDDPKNIFALAATLKAKGFQCVSSISANEGIDILKKDSTIKIVLLDMMMPETDGYEALRIIRAGEHISSIPVIAVTAQAMVGDKEKCIAAGADGYISKPIDVDKLMLVMKALIKR